MKKVITVIMLAAVIVAAGAGTVFGATGGGFSYKTTKAGARFYYNGRAVGNVKTTRRLAVKMVKSEKLTAHTLEHRKNRYVLVEVVKGKCINSRGDGKTADGYYISYKNVRGHKRGAKYTTYCVYANNNSIDDIVIRIDARG